MIVTYNTVKLFSYRDSLKMDMAAMVIDLHLIHYDDIWPLCEQYLLYITRAEILC